MKTCPACNTQYTDDTLVYCLQDGSPLTGGGRDMPTVVMDDADTVVRGRQWQQSEVTRVEAREQQPKGSKTAIAVILTAVVSSLVFGLIGFVTWILWLQPGPATANVDGRNANGTGRNVNVAPTITPTPTSIATPANGNVTPQTNIATPPPATPSVDTSRSRNEVSDRVLDHWKNSLEAGDLNRHMSGYASTVDYYRRRGANVAFVRADKARAFNRYTSMKVNVSNMDVSVDPSGETATATFDKEWTFSGAGTNAGKVRSELRFRLIGGRWLITGERDVRVYSTR